MFITINNVSYSILEFTGFRFISSAEHPVGIEIFYSGGNKIKKYFDTEAERDEFVEELGSSFVKLGNAYYNALYFTSYYKEDIVTPTPSYNIIAHYQGSTKLVFKFNTDVERDDFIKQLNDIIGGKTPDLSNYYTKTETDAKFNQLDITKRLIVQELPTQNISTKTIYMVPKTTSEEKNVYTEYMYIDNDWEIIGSTSVDLTNYLAKDNTAVYTPTGDYHPSTKKYVDDSIASLDWYVLDVEDIEKLTTSSTNEQIISAFGGQSSLDALITAIQSRRHLLAHNSGEYTNADGQFVSKDAGYIQYLSIHYFDVNAGTTFYIFLVWMTSSWSVNKIERGTPVLLENDQTITGRKTFNLQPICSSDPTNYAHLTNKRYVDSKTASLIIDLDDCIIEDDLRAIYARDGGEHAIFYYTPRVLSLDGFSIGFVLGFSNIRIDGSENYVYYNCVQYVDSSTQTVKVKDYRLKFDPTDGMYSPIELWEKDVTSSTWTSVHIY